MTSKSREIQALLLEGKNYPTIRKELGVAFSTIAYHAKKIGRQSQSINTRKFDWKVIQSFYDSGYSIEETREKFNIPKSTFRLAETNNKFVRDKKRSRLRREAKTLDTILESYFIENSSCSQSCLKKNIKKYGLLEYRCSTKCCPLHNGTNMFWCGNEIVLHLDHIDGRSDNNVLTNLRWLCPNCHSQTKTYCGRNKKRD